MDRGYLDVGVMNKVESMYLRYIIPTKDNPKVLRYKWIEMKYCDRGLSYLVLHDFIQSGKESVEARFVHIVYYPSGKRHDFSFYTNRDVNENNVMDLAETHRERGVSRTDTLKSQIRRKRRILSRWE